MVRSVIHWQRVIILPLLLWGILGYGVPAIFAQSGSAEKLTALEQRRAELQAKRAEELAAHEQEMQAVEEDIRNYQGKIEDRHREMSVLENDIADLVREIADIESALADTEEMVASLGERLQETETAIHNQEVAVQKKRAVLKSYLQAMYEFEDMSILELLLKEPSISAFFDTIERFQTIQQTVQQTLQELNMQKEELEQVRFQLQREQQQQQEEEELQKTQKAYLAQQRMQHTRNIEEADAEAVHFEQLVADSEQAKEEIQQNIYRLQFAGVEQDFSLQDVQALAVTVGDAFGLRPSFIMAMLKQESNLGQNTGTAHYLDAYTCNGAHDPEDEYIASQIEEFLKIVNALGRDPETTLVSACPGYGTGGAMGPSQFMPLTWRGYEEEVSAVTGHTPADPWNLADAMAAMGLKLSRNGAVAGNRESEFNAALIYFSGGVNHKYDWYAKSVLELADAYEEEF